MSRPFRTLPRERTDGWPDVPSVDPVGEFARLFAVNVRNAMGTLTLRAAQEVTGVHHTTIQAILQGSAWPDLETIAKLELGFGVALWPGLPGDWKV